MPKTKDNDSGTENLRLCRLRKWSNYKGLGFNIAKSAESPQTIEIVESNSPAAAGGLKITDVILNVNNQDVSRASNKDVSKAIKTALESNDPLELLVMEKRYYDKLKNKNVSFNPKMANKILETPNTMPRDYKNFPENTPRICQLSLNNPTETFGFDLIHGPNNIGAFIQEVNPNTPASKTTLLKSDRIIEIDDEFVDDQPYKDILNLMKEAKSNGALKLYVVDTKTYKHYQENNIPLQSIHNQGSSPENQASAPPYTNEPKVDSESIDGNENLSSPVISKLARPGKRPSKKESSNTQKLNTDDIRLCTINRANPSDTYGFAIEYDAEEKYHSLKLTSGRDNKTSNAELAGIKNKDRLIEINDENVQKMSTDDLKKRLKDNKYPNPLRLLVANAATYDSYKKQKKTINSQLSSVQKLSLDRNDRPPSPIDPSDEEPSLRRPSNKKPPTGDNKKPGMQALINKNPLDPTVPKPDSPADRRTYKLRIGSSASYGLKLNSARRDGLTHQITEIAPNSPAAKQGMRVGDYVLTINNREVQNMDKDEFNQCLRSSAKSAESRGDPLVLVVTSEDSYARPTTPDVTPPRSPSTLGVTRPRKPPTRDVTPPRSPSTPGVTPPRKPPTRDVNPSRESPSFVGATPPRKPPTSGIITAPSTTIQPTQKPIAHTTDRTPSRFNGGPTNRPSFKPAEPLPRKCVLIRDLSLPGCGFGLIENPNYDTPIVAELNPNSPAKRSGLAEGDHIIYIESQNIQNLGSFDNMTRLIQRKFQENGQVTLTTLTGPAYEVLKRRGGFLETDPFDYQSSNINQMKPRLYKLTLDTHEHDFGFSLQREDVLSIKSVKKTSPADGCGITKGDIVLELNGQHTNNLSSNQIKEIIEESERVRKLDILVIDIDGYRFSVKHAVPINSLLSFVQTNKPNIPTYKRVLL